MNQLREQVDLLAEQESREQEQAAQEKEEPPQNSDIRQLIREVCGIKVCEEQKQNMKDTMLELLEEKQEVNNIVKQPTKRRTRITESLQNFRVIHTKSSISLNNTFQISRVNAIAPVIPIEEPEYSLSMGDEHLSTTPKTESDKIIKSGVVNLVPIPSEYEGIFDNTCDVPVCEDSSTFDVLKDHSEILSDSNNDDTSSDDDAFEDIEYVEASLPDSELVSLEEENDVYQEEKEIDLEDILQIQDVILREKLLSNNRLIADIEFLNDNPTPDRGRLTSVVMNNISDNSTNDPLLEAVDLFLVLDNLIPSGIENIDYDSKGDIHFLEELLSNDAIFLPENESSNFDHHDDLSFPRPPPKPPDVEIFFEPDSGVLTTNVVKENEDKVFKHGILSYLLVSHRDKTTFDFSENPMMMYGGDIPLLDVPDLHTIPMDK
nr:hypothetical protein [Tanacetum cinerariifolium]